MAENIEEKEDRGRGGVLSDTLACLCTHDKGRDDETRVVNEETGGAKGKKSAELHHLPMGPLLDVTRVFEFGSLKYGDYNYQLGIETSLFFDAAFRHMAAYWGGEDSDPESGLPHLAHAVANLLMLMSQPPEMDRRPPKRQIGE